MRSPLVFCTVRIFTVFPSKRLPGPGKGRDLFVLHLKMFRCGRRRSVSRFRIGLRKFAGISRPERRIHPRESPEIRT